LQVTAVLAIVLVAGVIQGLSGFGSALFAVPLLLLLLPVETVVPSMALLGVANSALNLWHLRHAVHWSPLLPLLAGYVMGTPVGLLFLTRAPQGAILGCLGVFLTAFALLSLAGRQPTAPWLRRSRLGIGAVSGALGSAFSTNGPPVILHVAAHREWDADRQKATLASFFLCSSAITVLAHAHAGLVTGEVIRWTLWGLPALLAGALVGTWVYRGLGGHGYRQILFGLLFFMGLMLVVRALQAPAGLGVRGGSERSATAETRGLLLRPEGARPFPVPLAGPPRRSAFPSGCAGGSLPGWSARATPRTPGLGTRVAARPGTSINRSARRCRR